MKIKSLFLASSALLITAPIASATEPLPVDYVRVCDMAGAGYFFIPGTETCLQISGEAIYKIGFRSGEADGDAQTNAFDDQDGWEKEYEISLDFNTWRDTEFGALMTSIQFGASDATLEEDAGATLDDAGLDINEAYVALNGFQIGYTDSYYPGGLGASDLDAEGPDTGLIGYKFDLPDGAFAVALEDDGNDDWIPAIASVVSAEFGDVRVAAAGVYDDSADFFGAQLHAAYSYGSLSVDGSAQYSDNAASDYAADYEWVLGIGADYDVNDQLTVFAGLDYGIDQFGTAGDDDILVEVGADFELVEDFTIGFQTDFSDRRASGNFGWEDAEITFTRSF